METFAIMSHDEKRRYSLSRVWEHKAKMVNFICLNPSTADAKNDDATVKKLIKFAKAWGCGGIKITNLFSVRSTNPDTIRYFPFKTDLDNNTYIESAAHTCDMIVFAWGNHGGLQGLEMIRRFDSGDLKRYRYKCYFLKKNKSGVPAHPLYLKDSTRPQRFYK